MIKRVSGGRMEGNILILQLWDGTGHTKKLIEKKNLHYFDFTYQLFNLNLGKLHIGLVMVSGYFISIFES